MNFIDKDFLWNLVWLAPLFVLFFWFGKQARERLLKKFFVNADNPDHLLTLSRGKRLFRAGLLILAIFLLCIAAARPSWGKQILPYSGEGRDIMVLFDTSRSMLCKDVQPSRLEHAKWLVREIVKMNPGDRFGLIAFAGTAFLECPLTVDKTSFLQLVNELNTETIPLGGTNIQKALETAVKAFRAAEGSHKAVLLITDGDELYGNSSAVVDEIIRQKIPLIVAGVGDPAQPSIIQVPDGKGGLKTLKDEKGNIVNSPLNEKQMIELAQKSGGIYVRSTASDPGLNELETKIKSLNPKEFATGKQTRPIERSAYPLTLALLLLVLWFCISEKKYEKNLSTGSQKALHLILLAFGLFFTIPLSAQEQKAEPSPIQEQEQKNENLNNATELFNKGLEAQTSEKNEETALNYYEKAVSASADQTDARAKSYQNMGVIAHSGGRAAVKMATQELSTQKLEEAEKGLDNALKIFAKAEDHYREGMRSMPDASANIIRNQQLLLKDIATVQNLKKKIEELKKQQQEAQKQAQQALDQQQKENQQNQDRQQNQDQQQNQKNEQQNQDQQQNQKNEQQNQDQQQKSAQEQTQAAKEAAEKLEQQAKELSQEQMRQSAEKAKEDLKKAQDSQKEGKVKEAEEHLKDALESLGGKPDKDQNKSQDKDQQKSEKNDQKQEQNEPEQQDSEKNDKDGQKQEQNEQKQDADLPQQNKEQKSGNEAEPQDDKEIDAKQAEALLNLMSDDEKELRDALKERDKARYGTRPVEKDW